MSSTASAAGTGLPRFHSSICAPVPRRRFLTGLAKLPLIGGSVALLGQPQSVAQPATRQVLEAYKTWLHFEHRALSWELASLPAAIAHYGGTPFERYDQIERAVTNFGTGDASSYHRFDGSSPPSDRAALVLAAVGCDWRDDEAPADWLVPLRRA